jgi:RecA/RadA recombinase
VLNAECAILCITFLGSAGSGKTQLCLSSAVCAAWAGRNVLYIDCSNGLTLQRIEQLISLRAHRYALVVFISSFRFTLSSALLFLLTHLL